MNRKKCPICGCESCEKIIKAKNWEFNSRKLKNGYNYIKCQNCGVLYRESDSVALEAIYCGNYGNYDSGLYKQIYSKGLKSKIKYIRDSYCYMNKSKLLGVMISRIWKPYYPYLTQYKKLLSQNKKFLDVGCRNGQMVLILNRVGANAKGTEPYISDKIQYSDGTIIENKFLSDIDDKFDIIFYDNVFEHLEDPISDMEIVATKLKDGGVCGLVFPGYGNLTETYGGNSYIIQPPQHAFLHTEKSLRIIAEKAGLRVEKIERHSVFEWYVKSFLLYNKIYFNEKTDSLVSLLEKIDKNDKKELYHRLKFGTEGDQYHVILKNRN